MKKKILYLGNKLSKHGNNKTTIDNLELLFKKEGYLITCCSDKKNQYLRILDMIWTIITVGRKSDYILIDTYSTINFWYALICSQIARIFSVKYIPILHGGNLPNRLDQNPKLSSMLFINAYKNVSPSGFLEKIFKQKGYLNTIYIPNVLEIEQYTFKDRQNFEPRLLWVRAFDAIYNPELAIDVYKQIKEVYTNATLCMVGPDKDGSLVRLKQKAKEFQLDVLFTEKLSKKEWTDLSLDYDIFINTTHFDNRPVSVMEAMALGLVIISTNVGGLPYLIDHNVDGILVDDDNQDQMVAAIKECVENNSNTIKMAQKARLKVESFDWENVKTQWNSLLAFK